MDKKVDYSAEGFEDFLRELIETKRLDGSKEVGIAKLVIDKGIDSLSEKQRFAFEDSIDHYIFNECSRCHSEIPWCEMSAAEDNGGLCSWCNQVGSKDD